MAGIFGVVGLAALAGGFYVQEQAGLPLLPALALGLGLVGSLGWILYLLLHRLLLAQLRPLQALCDPPPDDATALAAAIAARLGALKEREQRFRSLLALSSDWYWERDAEGRLVYVSPGFREATGTDPETYLGSTRDSVHKLRFAPQAREYLEHCLGERLAFRDLAWELDLPDGRTLHAQSSGEPVFDGDGGFRGYRGVSRDIGPLKRAELALTRLNQELEARVAQRTEQLAQASRAAEAANQAKSRFLAHMSHEIRTPLNAVLGYAQLLRADPRLPPELFDRVAPIEKSSMHLLRLINDILDLSKIESGAAELKLVDFELGELLEELMLMFALRCQQKGLDQCLEQDFPGPCRVSGDAGKLRQVLFNLLGNAVKFTAAGTIGLSVHHLAANRYRFEVRDSGPGIPAPEQAVIFQPFQQAKQGELRGGTGLGLSIARRLVELMGGTLELSSLPGQGCCFHFELALASAHRPLAAGPDPGDAPAPRPPRRPRVLVVDDTETNRSVLHTMLEHLGVEVAEASNGEEALARLREQAIDLVLMDLYMPVMDGLHTLQHLRVELPGGGPPCVAVSASAFDHEREQCLQQGFDDFVAKPLLVDDIRRCLSLHLGLSFPELQVDTDLAQAPTAPAIPAALRRKLLDAVAISWLSGIKAGLQELDRLGPEARPLSERLQGLLRRYDLDGLRRELEDLRDGT
ncbi:MAG: response regulator [Gammaproteobacteria bacterium]|nr:response regulator [Gammaproteobacteria bacterium]